MLLGGGAGAAGVFWPDDATTRQFAAQFLQGGASLATASGSWCPGAVPLSQSLASTASTLQTNTASSQLPLTVPAGYKLAQDSITGQIWLVPSGQIREFRQCNILRLPCIKLRNITGCITI